jgi:hypothetical protein
MVIRGELKVNNELVNGQTLAIRTKPGLSFEGYQGMDLSGLKTTD